MADELIRHQVGIAVRGQPTYVVEVPTHQGREAAERRARWSVIHLLAANPDDITICPAEIEEVADA